jgi:2-octaprenyl-6-methoxyphenol hydroxylase
MTGVEQGPREGPALHRSDQRTTALVGPSVQLMKNLGVWALCAEHAAPVARIRITDDRGGLVRAPELVFAASEIGHDTFGANIANPMLLAALRTAAEAAPGVAWVRTVGVTGIVPAPASVHLQLAEGGSVETGLAIAADGRGSRAPAAAGIPVHAWDYPQAAVVASFGHSRAHEATVNELHRPNGPLTTVPLPGLRSAVVWVEAPGEARRLAGLGDDAFAAELEERLQGVLGTIGGLGGGTGRGTGRGTGSDISPRAVHPLGGRRAERMAARRIALVGEAAHVIAPIGAQGLNLGLRDCAALADCVAEALARGEDIGGDGVLAGYDRARAVDVQARTVATDLLNRSLLTDILPLDMLRGLAAHAIASLPPLRQLLMREGMGLAGPLPSLMRPNASEQRS